MPKQISKIKTIVLSILEKDLVTVLALGVVMLGVWFTHAATNTTNLGITILDAGTITITAPNGAENWQVDSTQHITWTTTGSIANVKIELQRETGGSWETLISSTTNDGDYPWLVTTPASTTATVRITSVNVPTITDSSDAVFTISIAPEAPSGGTGGYLPTYPAIDSISPMSFYYDTATELTIRGLGFQNWAWVTLNQITYPIQQSHSRNLILMEIQPNTLSVGAYRVCVYNSDKEFDCYMHLINVVASKSAVLPPTTGGGELIYSADLVRQSPNITLQPRETATVWVEYRNTGTATWYQGGDNPVRLGTNNKRDRRSVFYDTSWIKNNRPVLVNKVVLPGEIGRFEFTIKAPWRDGNYVEYFAPVAEWKTWISEQVQVKYIFTVKTLKRNWLGIPVIVKPVVPLAPTTGGKVELPFQPNNTLFFSDTIEKVYQWTVKTITNLFAGFSK